MSGGSSGYYFEGLRKCRTVYRRGSGPGIGDGDFVWTSSVSFGESMLEHRIV